MKKVVVFDLGGTLMEFKGMPPLWIDYYRIGIEGINKKFCLRLSDDELEKSVEILKSYNPRVNYRETEITPTEIFTNATEHWNTNLDIDSIIECFFDGMNLDTVIYDYAFELIEHYKKCCNQVNVLRFGDHHDYTSRELEMIVREAHNADVVITTDKDWQRISNKTPDMLKSKLLIQHIGVKFLFGGQQEFDHLIIETVRRKIFHNP